MKRLILIVGLMSLCVQTAQAQTKPDTTLPVKGETAAAKEPTLPAVEESNRMSAAVVELFNANKFDEALPLAKRALELREKALGVDHLWLVPFLSNLGEIYIGKNDYSEALPFFQRALEISEKKLGAEHPNVSTLLLRLGFISFIKGHRNQAEAFYQRALAIREKALGPDDMKVGDVAFLFADFYRYTGQFKKAEPLYERAVSIRGKVLGREHPDFIKTVERFGCVFYQGGQKDGKKEWEKRRALLLDPTPKDADDTGGVLNGKALSLPRPEYPAEAKWDRISGIVIVKVTIDEKGKVIEASDLCGSNPYLFSASRDAALRARFTPTQLAGQPVKVTGVITYDFLPR